jgi:hypothetical protein
MASCFSGRAASAPADAARWSEPWRAALVSWRGLPPWRASMASTSWLLRIRPAPGMARVCAMRCSSGMSSEERPAPPRLRDFGAVAVAPAAAGASSGAVGAPPRISVVSLTNGPSMILGRLGEPARPVDPVQRLLEPLLMRADLICAARYLRLPQRFAFLHASPCTASQRDKQESNRTAGLPAPFVPERERGILRQKPRVRQRYRPVGVFRLAPCLLTSTQSRVGHPVRYQA